MGGAKRPASIRWFERLYYFGLGLGVLNAWVDAHTDPDELGVVFITVSTVVATALNLLLLWLIAYRGSNVARWVFVGLVVLGMVYLVVDIQHARIYGDLSLALILIQTLLCAIEIWFLFRSDSRDWFAGRRPIDPEIFR